MNKEKEFKEKSANTSSQSSKKRSWKLVLLGMVILFCGMVIGSGITFHLGNVMMFHAVSPGGEMAERVMKRIDRRLDLTDSQRARVSEIVAHRVSVFKSIFMDSHIRIKEQFELLHDEIAQVLSKEQKLKWEKHYKKMQKVITRIHKRLLLPHQ
jgi:RNA 3'-terminal phosphate cyclase